MKAETSAVLYAVRDLSSLVTRSLFPLLKVSVYRRDVFDTSGFSLAINDFLELSTVRMFTVELWENFTFASKLRVLKEAFKQGPSFISTSVVQAKIVKSYLQCHETLFSFSEFICICADKEWKQEKTIAFPWIIKCNKIFFTSDSFEKRKYYSQGK